MRLTSGSDGGGLGKRPRVHGHCHWDRRDGEGASASFFGLQCAQFLNGINTAKSHRFGKRGKTRGGTIIRSQGGASRILCGDAASRRSRWPFKRRSEELGAEAIGGGGRSAANDRIATR